MKFYELKEKVINKGGESHFFDHDTLKFFGERLSEMKVLNGFYKITDVCGEEHVCYCLSAIRHKNAFGACKPYTVHHYFDKETFRHVIQ